ncbi:MAG: serine hydrolase [Proteobacteria bacterium]|nr:serine hydrolase [Pseudomonadota bacterium]
MQEIVEAYHALGLFQGAVMVTMRDEIVYRGAVGFANEEWGILNTPDTRFTIASLGKAFTAVMILQLQEEGLLSVGDRVQEHVTEFQGGGRGRITIEHLLHHTAGIPWPQDEWEPFQFARNYELSEIISLVLDEAPVGEPGGEFAYCNSCYHLLAAIIEESGDIEKEHFAAEEQIRESRAESARATDQLAELEAQRAALESQREDLRAELHRVRAQADEDRMQAHDLAIQYETRRSSKDSTAQSLARMESQRRHFGNREQEIRQQLQQSEAPLESNKEQLEILLKTRVTVESELGESRRRVEEVEGLLRDLDQSRMSATLSVEESQAFVNEARMAVQEIRVRREGFSEQLDQTGFELGELLEGLDEEADPDSWDEKLEKIRRRIDRLGPINLAAIDEFKEQSERKEYLDSQLADLNDALATLEGAIHKIDRETRTRFRETFANVDAGFKRLFPKLFGGGHAYLELTGDDLLTAGVTVMARPPGKRNSTIHLLSGGEKALTAVALVFAIFELNPAPFCLLDEVDAPLDDANIVRFCRIVKDMADKVQFVFITHNKVTMEMARQLTGITMQEPGVSRVVAVDLDEAVKMAAS